MAETLEVMSIEDSRLMDVSLCSASAEGVQSTSRSWKRRFLLVVAPVLGVALASAAVYNKVAARGVVGSSTLQSNAGMKGGTQEASSKVESQTFREFVTGNAVKSGLDVLEFPSLVLQVPDKLPPRCDTDPLAGFASPISFSLAKELTKGLEYRGYYFLEPGAGPLTCQTFYGLERPFFYCKQGDESQVGTVTDAVVVLKLPEAQRDEFFKVYKHLHPLARMASEMPMSITHEPLEGDFFGVVRPAASARALTELFTEMDAGPRSFELNLALIVHSALRQLNRFYTQTGYRFHGGINDESIEVLMDLEDGHPLTAYVGREEEAIRWHIKASKDPQACKFANLAPPEANIVSKDYSKMTDKFDVYSAGLAMYSMLCRRHLDACRVALHPKTWHEKEPIEKAAVSLVKSRVPWLAPVVARMVKFRSDRRAGVDEALGLLERAIVNRWEQQEQVQLGALPL